MSEATRIANILGGRSVLKKDINDIDDLMEITRKGLPTKSVFILMGRTGVRRELFETWITLSSRTFTRRMGERYFKPDESDRAVRIARVVARAEDALGSPEKARAWLTRPNRALGMVPPYAMFDTDLGVQRVMEVLGRIEHGTFS